MRALPILALMVLSLVACAEDEAPVIAGDYILIAFDNAQLPVDLGALPDSVAGEACRRMVTGGELRMHHMSATAHYYYQVRNSCTNAVLSQPELTAMYSQHGHDLDFSMPGAGGANWFSGSVSWPEVTIVREGMTLRYRMLAGRDGDYVLNPQ